MVAVSRERESGGVFVIIRNGIINIMKRKEKERLKVHVIDSSRLINHIVVSLLNIV
jgi:hypothetical protein